ncbi:MAG: DUF2955 domain-containing protein, partial [Pseudoxanthomonas sp.]
FAVAGSSTFLASEFMQWTPTFLAPVLAVVLLVNLPGRPPPKVIVALVVVTAAAALGSWALTSLLRDIPGLLVAVIALATFLCFYFIAMGRPAFPLLLTLISLATIPVVAMVAPAQAGALPAALIRGITLAMAAVWIVHTLWPATPGPAPPAPAPAAASPITPFMRALVSVMVVVPMMVGYLLFGWADVLPVLVATVMLVVTFDAQRSRLQAVAMITGNFAGGLLGLLLYGVLSIAPGLLLLGLIVFTMLLGYGATIAKGGAAAGALLIACNATFIIFASAIATGPAPLSLWLARLFQFAVAGAFSVATMSLFWHYYGFRRAAPPSVEPAR